MIVSSMRHRRQKFLLQSIVYIKHCIRLLLTCSIYTIFEIFHIPDFRSSSWPLWSTVYEINVLLCSYCNTSKTNTNNYFVWIFELFCLNIPCYFRVITPLLRRCIAAIAKEIRFLSARRKSFYFWILRPFATFYLTFPDFNSLCGTSVEIFKNLCITRKSFMRNRRLKCSTKFDNPYATIYSASVYTHFFVFISYKWRYSP